MLIIFTDVVVHDPELRSGDNGKRKTREADTWTCTQEDNTMNYKEFLFSLVSWSSRLPKRQTMQHARTHTHSHSQHVNKDLLTSVCELLSFTGFRVFVMICVFTCVCLPIVSGVIFRLTQWQCLCVLGGSVHQRLNKKLNPGRLSLETAVFVISDPLSQQIYIYKKKTQVTILSVVLFNHIVHSSATLRKYRTKYWGSSNKIATKCRFWNRIYHNNQTSEDYKRGTFCCVYWETSMVISLAQTLANQ